MSKVILITGASSGMGKEAAKKLIEAGHTVYAVARRMEQMQDLKQMGGIPMPMDVTNEQDIDRVVQTIMQQQGKIDVLWNNEYTYVRRRRALRGAQAVEVIFWFSS